MAGTDQAQSIYQRLVREAEQDALQSFAATERRRIGLRKQIEQILASTPKR